MSHWSESTVLSCYRGSIAHNLELQQPRQGFVTGDIDKLTVFVYPKDYYFSLDSYKNQRRVYEHQQGNEDFVSYELQKFFDLLVNLNPNVTPVLYLKPEFYLQISPAAEILLGKKYLFNSKEKIRQVFLGYAHHQFELMTSHHAYFGYQGEKRRQLYQHLGYDAKNASHAVRLLRVAQEWLRDGEPQIYRIHDREELLAIKCGEYPLEAVTTLFGQELQKTEAAYQQSRLPANSDPEQLKQLLLEMFALFS